MSTQPTGVFVTFKFGSDFNEVALRQIASGARAKFEGLPGLRSKIFTIDAAAREATNFYVWDSEATAKSFFTDQLLERVTALYGVRPTLRYVHIAEIVANAA